MDGGITISGRQMRALQYTDDLDPALRACVHEFGDSIVNACVQAGVTQPNRIRQLVHEIWLGARQPQQRAQPLGYLDWLLVQSGSTISAATLVQSLRQGGNLHIIPGDPSPQMVTASIEAIRGMGLLTKSEKHKIRLRAAIKAASVHLWPRLNKDKAA